MLWASAAPLWTQVARDSHPRPAPWRGAVAEGLSVPVGGLGRYSVRVLRGLVRLGWLADGGSVDNLGIDHHGFGFGGTGKRSHAGHFISYGEAFGAGDVIGCVLDRSGGRLRIAYSKNSLDLGAAFDLTPDEVAEVVAGAPLMPAVCGKDFEAELLEPSAPTPTTGGDGISAAAAVVAGALDGTDELLAAVRCYCSRATATSAAATAAAPLVFFTGAAAAATAAVVKAHHTPATSTAAAASTAASAFSWQ